MPHQARAAQPASWWLDARLRVGITARAPLQDSWRFNGWRCQFRQPRVFSGMSTNGRHKVRTVRARHDEWVRVVRPGSGGGGGGGGSGWLIIAGLVVGCCVLHAIITFIMENAVWIALLVAAVIAGKMLLTSRASR